MTSKDSKNVLKLTMEQLYMIGKKHVFDSYFKNIGSFSKVPLLPAQGLDSSFYIKYFEN